MNSTKIYLDLPADIQLLLEENRVLIPQVLADAGIEHTLTYEALPAQEDAGARSKDAVMVLFAAGGLALAVGAALSQVITTIHQRPRLVEIYTLEEVRHVDGSLVTDAWGQPLFRQVKRYELLEPQAANNQRDLELRVNPRDGLVIKVCSDDQQIPPRQDGASEQKTLPPAP